MCCERKIFSLSILARCFLIGYREKMRWPGTEAPERFSRPKYQDGGRLRGFNDSKQF